MDTEHKAAQLKAVNDDGSGRAVFATFNEVDKDYDITDPGAFGQQDVMVLPTHNWGSVPLGKGVTVEEGNMAMVDFKLNLETAAGRDWHAALKFDLANGRSIQEWSYGFTILEAERSTRDGEEIRVLKSVDVHEVSPVIVGAGVGTRTLDVKGSKRFEDQIGTAIDEVSDIIKRAEAIREARQEDGRDLSKSRLQQLSDLKDQLDRFVELRDRMAHVVAKGDDPQNSKAAPDVATLLAEVEATRARLSGRG